MCVHPDLTSQLADEHRRQMLMAASRRQLRRGQGRQAAGTANSVGAVTRRIATAIAGTRLAALRSSTTGRHVAVSDSGASGRPHETAAMSGRQTD